MRKMIQYLTSGETVVIDTDNNTTTSPLHHAETSADLGDYNLDFDIAPVAEGFDYKVIR